MNHINLVEETKANTHFQRVIHSGDTFQVVLMAIPEYSQTETEVHPTNIQFIVMVSGEVTVNIDKCCYLLTEGSTIIVPSGSTHYITNRSNTCAKLYTIYDGTVH